MNVLVLTPPGGANAEGIQAVLDQAVPENGAEFYTTVGGLIRRLRKPVDIECITILVPGSREELADLVACESILNCTRIVLVVPDEEEATISLAHRLYPRVLLHAPNFLEALVLIIAKMGTNPAPYSSKNQ